MIKVGDTVRLVERFRGWCDDRNFGRYGIVTGISGNYADVVFEGDDTLYKCDNGNIAALEVIHDTPPQKITQNGYEYELVGPVKPEWLVDGAWVVRKDNGCKHQVVLNKNGLLVLTMPGTDATILPNHHIYDQYRPHTASDWKWGDWAMYAGRKVFVIERGNWKGDIRVSHPDLPDGVDYVPVLQLTPTF